MMKYTKLPILFFFMLFHFSTLHAGDPKSLVQISARAVLKNLFKDLPKPVTEQQWISLKGDMLNKINASDHIEDVKGMLRQQIAINSLPSRGESSLSFASGALVDKGFAGSIYMQKKWQSSSQMEYPDEPSYIIVSEYGKVSAQNIANLSPKNVLDLEGEFIIQADISQSHHLLLTRDGKVFAFGNNGFGQLGLGDQKDRDTYTPIAFPTQEPIKQIATGPYRSLFLTSAGRVFISGQDVCQNWHEPILTPQGIQQLEGYNIDQVASAGVSSLFLTKEGQVLALGFNCSAQLGVPNIDLCDAPTIVPFPTGTRIAQISLAETHALFLTKEGQVFAAGANFYRQLGPLDQPSYDRPTLVPLPKSEKAARILAFGRNSFIWLERGGWLVFGPNPQQITMLWARRFLWDLFHG